MGVNRKCCVAGLAGMMRGRLAQVHVVQRVEIAEGVTGRGMMGGARLGLRLLHLFESLRSI